MREIFIETGIIAHTTTIFFNFAYKHTQHILFLTFNVTLVGIYHKLKFKTIWNFMSSHNMSHFSLTHSNPSTEEIFLCPPEMLF